MNKDLEIMISHQRRYLFDLIRMTNEVDMYPFVRKFIQERIVSNYSRELDEISGIPITPVTLASYSWGNSTNLKEAAEHHPEGKILNLITTLFLMYKNHVSDEKGRLVSAVSAPFTIKGGLYVLFAVIDGDWIGAKFLSYKKVEKLLLTTNVFVCPEKVLN